MNDQTPSHSRTRKKRALPQSLTRDIRSQADTLLAFDFLETVTLTGARLYVFAVIEHASRRIQILGTTAHPTASWVTQAAKNLAMDLEDAGHRAKFLIRDRDGKFPELFDTTLNDAGSEIVLSGVRLPRMNAIMEQGAPPGRRLGAGTDLPT